MRPTLLFLLLSLTTLFAAEQKHYLREFSPGKPLAGARLTSALQKDKGTVLIFWLYEFEKPRNGAALKSFQKIADDYKDSLVVVGIENSPGNTMKPVSAKEILTLTKAAGVSYSIYSSCKTPIEVHTYPTFFIFDREGHMIHGGVMPEADEFESLLKKAGAPIEKKDGKEEPKQDEKEKPKADPKKAA
jgi:hypothetical protein